MNAALKIIYFFTDLILPLMIGYLLKRRSGLKPELFDKMIYSNILILAPLLGLLSFWNISLRMELIWLPVLGVIMQVIPGVAGFFRVKHKYSSPLDQGGYILSTMLSNRGVVGTLSLFILFGENGYAYSRLVMLFSSVVLYMFCFPMAEYFYQSHKGSQRKGLSLRKILLDPKQIPVLGILVGLFLNFTGLKRPDSFSELFDGLVHLSAWMAVLPIGHSLDFGEMKRYWGDIFELVGIKFLITPLLTGLLAVPFVRDPEALASVVIISAAPTAINAVITAKLHKLNIHLAMAAFVTTTAAYLFVVFPIILWVVERVMPL